MRLITSTHQSSLPGHRHTHTSIHTHIHTLMFVISAIVTQDSQLIYRLKGHS